MSTVDSSKIIAKILSNNGIYQGEDEEDGQDPQVWAVYRYKNMGGRNTYKIIYPYSVSKDEQVAEFVSSPYVSEPLCLFDRPESPNDDLRQNWLTEAGKQFLSQKGQEDGAEG